jgi:hypothetical protein
MAITPILRGGLMVIVAMNLLWFREIVDILVLVEVGSDQIARDQLPLHCG